MTAGKNSYKQSVDPVAAKAFDGPGRVELEQWRCTNKDCRERVATLWSTPAGRILTWSSPVKKTTAEDRRLLIDAGVPHSLDGSYLHIQFVTDGSPARLLVVCPKHGPREISPVVV